MNSIGGNADSQLEQDLVRWGKAIAIGTRGRKTGLPRVAVVGYLDHDDGSLSVAASHDQADWAQNLLAYPVCTVRLATGPADFTAHPLEGDERLATISGLILKYGTPAERQGSGPAFRLVRIEVA